MADDKNGKKRAPRSTKKEYERRVQMVRKMLAARMTNGEIKRIASTQFGTSPRTVEEYIRRARALMLAEIGKSVEEHRSDAYALYCSIIANPNTPDRERIKAQERIDKLLGLESPVKFTQTDMTGKRTYHAAMMREMMEMAERYADSGQVITDGEIESLVESAVIECVNQDDDDEPVAGLGGDEAGLGDDESKLDGDEN